MGKLASSEGAGWPFPSFVLCMAQEMKDMKSKLDFGFTWKRLHATGILLPVVLCCPLSQAYCPTWYPKPRMQIDHPARDGEHSADHQEPGQC